MSRCLVRKQLLHLPVTGHRIGFVIFIATNSLDVVIDQQSIKNLHGLALQTENTGVMLLLQTEVHCLNCGEDEAHPAILLLTEGIQYLVVEDEERQDGAACAECLPEGMVVLQPQVAPEPADGHRHIHARLRLGCIHIIGFALSR